MLDSVISSAPGTATGTETAGPRRSPSAATKHFGGLGRIVRWGSEHFWFVLLLGLLPLLLYGAGLTAHLSNQQDDIAERRVQQAALRAAHSVDRTIQTQLGLLEGLATSTALDDIDFSAFRTEMERLWQLHPEWRTVILTDDTRMLINMRYPPGAALPEVRDPPTLQHAWSAQKAVIGDLRNGRASLRVPVRRDGKTKYTLVAAVEPQLFNTALSAAAIPEGWTAALVDGDAMLAGRNADTVGEIGSSLADRIRALGLGKDQGVSRAIEAAGSYKVAAQVGASSWQVLIEAPTATVKRQLIETRYAVWLGAGAAAIFALILTSVLLRQWAARREVARLASTNTALAHAVSEKDTLLAEVHHRVKNNLQLVEALMAIQSNDVTDQKSHDAWQAIRRRIGALGLVHQQLLRSQDLAHFDLRPFLEDLCRNIERAFAPEGREIRIVADIESMTVTLDLAIPLGLLVNEFVSNVFKHAFPMSRDPGQAPKEIRVQIETTGSGEIRLVIADNGVGGWAGVESRSEPRQSSVGLQIARSLIAQLRGRLDVCNDEGTQIEVVIPAPTPSNRKQAVKDNGTRKS